MKIKSTNKHVLTLTKIELIALLKSNQGAGHLVIQGLPDEGKGVEVTLGDEKTAKGDVTLTYFGGERLR